MDCGEMVGGRGLNIVDLQSVPRFHVMASNLERERRHQNHKPRYLRTRRWAVEPRNLDEDDVLPTIHAGLPGSKGIG